MWIQYLTTDTWQKLDDDPVYDPLAGRSGIKTALQLLWPPIQAPSPAAPSPGFGFGHTSLSRRMKVFPYKRADTRMRRPGRRSTSAIPIVTPLLPIHKRYTEVFQPKPTKGTIGLPQVTGIRDPHYPSMVSNFTPTTEEETGHCGGTKLQASKTLMGLVLSLYLQWGSRLTTITSGNWFWRFFKPLSPMNRYFYPLVSQCVPFVW